MKKSLLALAALTAFAGVASAQSSVTLFGIVDLAATNVKNGSAGSLKTLSSGQSNTSRLGFRGVEDLGGGMKAGFWIESEVGADTGAGGSTVSGANVFWARRSTVSLMGSFGELRLGRDFVPTYSTWGAADLFGYVGVATTANLRGAFLGQGSITTGVRGSNQIMYFLPAMGGLYGNINLGAGEGPAGDKYIGGRLGYAAGPLNFSGAYGKTERGTAEMTTMAVSGSFNAGFATLVAGYEKSEYDVNNTDRTLMTVGVRVPMGKGQFKAAFTKSSGTGAAATRDQYDATSFGLGYDYSLSKRTMLYANYGSINNGGTAITGANYTATGNGPAGIKRGETSSGYQFGVRHDF